MKTTFILLSTVGLIAACSPMDIGLPAHVDRKEPVNIDRNDSKPPMMNMQTKTEEPRVVLPPADFNCGPQHECKPWVVDIRTPGSYPRPEPVIIGYEGGDNLSDTDNEIPEVSDENGGPSSPSLEDESNFYN